MPSEVRDAPSFKEFKARLDGGLADLVVGVLFVAGELGLVTLKGPF